MADLGRFMANGVAVATIVLTALGCGDTGDLSATEGWRPGVRYPSALRMDLVEDFFGTPVADPYRWLEDMESAETGAWVEAQNALSFPFLRSLPARERIEERLEALWDYERFGLPVEEGGRYFFEYNSGLLDQDLLYVLDSPDGEPRLLIDPNTFSEDATVGMVGFEPSPDGRILAYATSDGGSDWRDWHFRDVTSGDDLTDLLTFTKFTDLSWARDGSGVYYSRYPVGPDGRGDDSRPVSVYFHVLGTPQSEDRQVYDLTGESRHRGLDPHPYAKVTEDGRYLVIQVQAGYHENQVHVIDLRRPAAGARRVIGEWRALFELIGSDGSWLYLTTTSEAPNSRVIAIDVENPNPDSWREIVPEAEEALQDASLVGGHVVAEYLRDATSLIRIFTAQGRAVREVELPGLGTAKGFEGHGDDPETFFSYTDFTTPTEVYRYDVTTGQATVFRRPTVDIDTTLLETRQVFFESKDGTRVPMFLVHRTGLQLDGDNPTLLYGYGGFNVSYTPTFSVSRMVWLELGGVYALANIRGGGEYGKQWHLAGTGERKQNVFDDFIAAAEWLLSEGYATSSRLAIHGGSNGGLLVAACANQRPELYGAVLAEVGVLDMIRYHRPSANARNWSTDYGLSENEDDFRAQIAYSPYHNVVEGTCYPPTLITTADHDDRVVPWHSYKYAAALQHAQACRENPILIRIETRAGHSAGKPTWMKIEEIADEWAFLTWALDR